MTDRWVYLRDHFWFDLKVGGSVVHTSGVINALNRIVNLQVLTNDELPGINCDRVKFIPPKFKFPSEVASLIYSCRSAVSLRAFKPDKIYTRYSAFSLGWLFYKLAFPGVFVVLEYNSSDYWKLRNWKASSNSRLRASILKCYYTILLPFARFTEFIQLKFADRVIVVSSELMKRLIGRGVDSGKIYFYHNGVDKNLLPSESGFRRIEGPYFFWVGTFGQWHGVDSLLEAFKQFTCRNSNVKLVMSGSGPLHEYARNFVENSDLKDRIILTGQVSHKESISLMRKSLACLNTPIDNADGTPFFGSPTKLFEYFLSSRPVLSSDVESLNAFAEFFISYSQGKSSELADLMFKVAQDNDAFDDLALKARDMVMNKYTWDHHIENVLHGLI